MNLTHVRNDDERALLMVEYKSEGRTKLLLNERDVIPNLSHSIEKRLESKVWYLDNGASNHMIGFRGKFKSLDEGVTGQVRFGDGSTVVIKSKGIVGFKCKNREQLEFHEVYYIPEMCNNIISIG